MNKSKDPAPKSPTSHLHVMNLIVALVAGIISITGGIYTLKNNIFSEAAFGNLQGVVRDVKIAKPLYLTTIEVSGTDGAVVNTVTTDKDGQYLVQHLKTGNYIVKFTAPLHTVETKTVKIEKDATSSINIDLVPIQEQMKAIVPEQTVPVQVTAPAGNAPSQVAASSSVPSYGNGNTVNYGNAQTAQTSSGYPQQSYEQVPDMNGPGPQPPPYHHRRPRGYYAATGSDQSNTTSTTSSASQGSALAQAGAQLLEGFLSKKTSQN
ncbi:MAG TPA: carboxypeptidase-like regulatory domain-containing protein [Candidatus Omnitrophota bacterium]|nr:carboxypeptidase-like regulatory domain-containing protein [Candidatus Omnitrophota bacterium]HPS37708.1 carboxypeptidase-like regulatory domain-containing protein [Candidatus Omnitrophota bacterium]